MAANRKPSAELFDTAHLMGDLKGRSARGGAVTLVSQGGLFILQMGATVVLARLLIPADFGLIAMVAAFTGFAGLFRDLGLSTATVQRASITHAQVSTLFWINVGVSLLLALTGAALAPAVAWFYREPRLLAVTAALCGTFVFGGIAAQHTALLRRQMRYGRLAAVELTALAAGFAAAVWLALRGAGYWSLVGFTAVRELVAAVVSWCVSPWRPGRPVRASGVRPMLAFGGNLTGAGVLNYIGGTLDHVLLGWFWGPALLGLYAKANSLLRLPLNQLNPPLAAVAVPTLSRLVERPDAYRRGTLALLAQLAVVTGPLMALMIVGADWLIALVLGPQWTGAVPLFRILGFAGLLLPVWNATGWLFVSQGRTREHLHFHMIDSAAKVLSVLAGLPWGALGVATGVAVRYYVIIPLLFYWCGRRGPVATRDFYRALAYPAMLTVLCFAVLGLYRLAVGEMMAVAGLGVATGLTALTVFAGLAVTPAGRALLVTLRDSVRAMAGGRTPAPPPPASESPAA